MEIGISGYNKGPAHGSHQYREAGMVTNRPEKNVLMLYEGAIDFLKSAAMELRKNNIIEKLRLIDKGTKILDYLQSTLDKEKGGDVAENLDRLYDYMLQRLTEANLKNDAAKVDEVVNLLRVIRDGWAEMCVKVAAQSQPGLMEPVATPDIPKGLAVSI